MRPLLVLTLVIGAIAALLFAILKLPGKGSEETPIEPPVTLQDTPQSQDQVDLATGPDVERAVDEPQDQERRVSSGDDGKRYENTLTGTVITNRQQPVARARVLLTRFVTQAIFDGGSTQDNSRNRVILTDAEGRYTFKNVEPYDTYGLVVTHEDYARTETTARPVGEVGIFEARPIVMKNGCVLKGYVRDLDDNPIVGALVASEPPPGLLGAGISKFDKTSVLTDANGFYRLQNLTEGLRSLTVTADGFGNLTLANLKLNTQKEWVRNVQLVTAEMIGGRVLGPGDIPLAQVNVIASSNTNTRRSSRSQTRTNSQGNFRFKDLNPGVYSLRALTAGYKPARAQRIEAGDMNVTLRLSEMGVLRGTVVDDETSQPLTKGLARLRRSDPITGKSSPLTIEQAFENPEGRFNLRGIPPGTYQVEADVDGYAPSYSEAFTIKDGQIVPGIVVRQNRGGRIVGRAVDDKGDPVAKVRVTTHDNSWNVDVFSQALGAYYPTEATSREVWTDDEGRFEIVNLRPSTYQVRVYSQNFCTEIRHDIEVAMGKQRPLNDLRLRRGGSIRGTLLDKTGARIIGGQIRLSGDGAPGVQGRNHRTKSGEGGVFSFENIYPGPYIMTASRPPGPDINPLEVVLEFSVSERKVIVRENDVASQDLTIGG